MKLRLLPVVISVLVCSGLLFGGWFVYRSVALDSPLSDVVHRIQGVEQARLHIDRDQVQLDLKLDNHADLRKIVDQIHSEGAAVIGSRKLQLKVEGNPSEALDQWWSRSLFEVAEAMETRQYAKIPEALHRMESSYSGLRAETEMDDENVYIRLTEGEHSKFVILPRQPAMMGMWSHE